MKLVRCSTVLALTFGLAAMGTAAWATPAAPEILSPHAGDTVLSPPVIALGMSDPEVFVHVYLGTTEIGLGIPDPSGLWDAELALGDGSHTIRARALDAGGSWGPYSAAVTFTVDLPPAKPVWTKPASNARTNNQSVLLEGSAEAGTTVTLRENGAVIASALPLVSGKWTTTLTFSEATHTISATAIDAIGRESEAATRAFTVDLTAPGAPTITTPTEAAYLNSSTVTVAGTAEPGATVTIYEGTTARRTTTANASGVWNTSVSGVAQGAHAYTAKAKDAANNVGPPSPARRFTVDTTAPTLTIATPNNAVFILDDRGEISGTATDSLSGVTRIELHYEFTTGADRGTRDASCSGCIATSVTWRDVPAMMPGYYMVEAVAIDRAGNRSPVATVNFLQANP